MELIETPYLLQEREHYMHTVTSFENTNIINVQLQANEVIPDQELNADMIVIVKSGVVSYNIGGEMSTVTPNKILHIGPNETHSLKAEEASDMILIQVFR